MYVNAKYQCTLMTFPNTPYNVKETGMSKKYVHALVLIFSVPCPFVCVRFVWTMLCFVSGKK